MTTQKIAPVKKGKKTKDAPENTAPKSIILEKILVTEKTSGMADKNQYTFTVAKNATKNEIKKEIEKIYKVKPVSVNTLRVKPRSVFKRGKMGTLKGIKKAVVTLKKGDTLPLAQ
jgi:large subunit ribosomal protein L23